MRGRPWPRTRAGTASGCGGRPQTQRPLRMSTPRRGKRGRIRRPRGNAPSAQRWPQRGPEVLFNGIKVRRPIPKKKNGPQNGPQNGSEMQLLFSDNILSRDLSPNLSFRIEKGISVLKMCSFFTMLGTNLGTNLGTILGTIFGTIFFSSGSGSRRQNLLKHTVRVIFDACTLFQYSIIMVGQFLPGRMPRCAS